MEPKVFNFVKDLIEGTQLEAKPVDEHGTIAHRLDAEAWNKAVKAQRLEIQEAIKKLIEYRNRPLNK